MNLLETSTKDFIELLKKYNVLLDIVKGEMLESKISKVELNEDEKQNIKDYIMKSNGLENEEAYNQWIIRSQTNEENLYNLIGKNIKIDKYCAEQYSHKFHSQFLKRKSELDRVVYSLIRVKDQFLAQELYLRIKEGEDFGQLAKEYSCGPEKMTRGIVGPVSIEKSNPELTKLLKSSKENEINQPILISDWCLIVRLESFIEASLTEDVEKLMGKEILDQVLQEEASEILKSMNVNSSTNKFLSS